MHLTHDVKIIFFLSLSILLSCQQNLELYITSLVFNYTLIEVLGRTPKTHKYRKTNFGEIMKTKLLGLILSVGFATTAHAGAKIFEWNDPVQGNYPPECSAVQTYGTGGGGYLYTEYSVSCPGHPSIAIGKYESFNGYGSSCTITSKNSNYTTSFNNCNNWRVYVK
jgi:hypothetical protein